MNTLINMYFPVKISDYKILFITLFRKREELAHNGFRTLKSNHKWSGHPLQLFLPFFRTFNRTDRSKPRIKNRATI